jgi:hypothetical protein
MINVCTYIECPRYDKTTEKCKQYKDVNNCHLIPMCEEVCFLAPAPKTNLFVLSYEDRDYYYSPPIDRLEKTLNELKEKNQEFLEQQKKESVKYNLDIAIKNGIITGSFVFSWKEAKEVSKIVSFLYDIYLQIEE